MTAGEEETAAAFTHQSDFTRSHQHEPHRTTTCITYRNYGKNKTNKNADKNGKINVKTVAKMSLKLYQINGISKVNLFNFNTFF